MSVTGRPVIVAPQMFDSDITLSPRESLRATTSLMVQEDPDLSRLIVKHI
jgi:hypothetical protein